MLRRSSRRRVVGTSLLVGVPRRGRPAARPGGLRRAARRQHPLRRGLGPDATSMAPLLLVAIGAIVATRAGLVNIGQEGQLLVGACFGAYLAVRLPGPGPVVLVCTLLFARPRRRVVGRHRRRAEGRGATCPRCSRRCCSCSSPSRCSRTACANRGSSATATPSGANHINSGKQIPFDTPAPRHRRVRQPDRHGRRDRRRRSPLAVACRPRPHRLGARIDVLGLNPRAAQRFGVPQRPLGRRRAGRLRALRRTRRAVLLHGRRVRRPPVVRLLGQLRLGRAARRAARPQPRAGGDPDGVRLRRAAHRFELPRRDRRRPQDDRRRAGAARARAAPAAGHRVPAGSRAGRRRRGSDRVGTEHQ